MTTRDAYGVFLNLLGSLAVGGFLGLAAWAMVPAATPGPCGLLATLLAMGAFAGAEGARTERLGR